MYKILSTNHQTKTQTELYKICYLDRAIELCEIEAINFVVAKEGEKYLKRAFYRKANLPEGYSIVKNNNDFMGKYTVYFREKNGYLLRGEVKKIMTFITFKVQPEPLCERISYMSTDAKENFSYCISYIDENVMMNLHPTNPIEDAIGA